MGNLWLKYPVKCDVFVDPWTLVVDELRIIVDSDSWERCLLAVRPLQAEERTLVIAACLLWQIHAPKPSPRFLLLFSSLLQLAVTSLAFVKDTRKQAGDGLQRPQSVITAETFSTVFLKHCGATGPLMTFSIKNGEIKLVISHIRHTNAWKLFSVLSYKKQKIQVFLRCMKGSKKYSQF
jgi:hypothetical protein